MFDFAFQKLFEICFTIFKFFLLKINIFYIFVLVFIEKKYVEIVSNSEARIKKI
jgi:hypothetical protein